MTTVAAMAMALVVMAIVTIATQEATMKAPSKFHKQTWTTLSGLSCSITGRTTWALWQLPHFSMIMIAQGTLE
jgi:hypothetical protein